MKSCMIGFGAAVISMLMVLPAIADDADGVDACVRAVKAQQQAFGKKQRNVGANYQPGVDVYGRKVAPADVSSSYSVKPPEVIEFDIQYDVAKRLGMNASNYYEGSATVAKVRIEGDRIFVNGEELYSSSAADLVAACRRGSQ